MKSINSWKKRLGSPAAAKLIFFAMLVALWELVFLLNFFPAYLFPSPVSVVKTLFYGFADLSFIFGILVSMKRLLIGYSISVLGGIALGALIAHFKLAKDTIGSLVLGISTIPSIAWLPLALIWFGLNESAIIFIIIIGSIFSMTMSTYSGIQHIPPLYLKAARNLGARELKLQTKVVLPAAFPSIVVGMKQSWSFGWRSLLAGELLFVNGGLGQLLTMGRELNDMSQVIAVMVVILFIGILVERLFFACLEKSIKKKWG